jgi:flavin reductase (DIM6/NTAB) family NADH-FMN oxidoreductase RutF
MTANPEDFRQTMRQWVTGVTIVSVEQHGNLHGMTVNSFTSLSLYPPLVLVSLERSTRTHDILLQTGFFGVTILAHDQWQISDRFAGRMTEDENRFESLETFRLVTGAPFLVGGVAFFDCRVLSQHDIGTHTVFVGNVLAVLSEENKQPLVYYNRNYRGLRDDYSTTVS